MRASASGRVSPSALFYLAAFAIVGLSSTFAQDLPTLTGTTNNAIPTAVAPTTASKTTADKPETTGQEDASNTLPDITSLAGSSLPTDSDKPGKPKLSDLPTLSGAYSYPPPSVPPTAKAPYMQQSQLPEGTIFIAVGAALGFFALAIIAWRGLVAWSLNRSVRRSAAKGYTAVAETSYDKSDKRKSGMYSTAAPTGSTMSLDNLASSNRPVSMAPKITRENSNLFFSPTAGAGSNPSGNRNSGYLPSGYYASSNAALAGGAGLTTVGGPGDRGSKMRPHSEVYSSTRALDPSPPVTPDLRPSTANVSTADSRSTLNLSAYTQNRAPSTYLDDLMSTPPVPQHGKSPDRRKRDSPRRNH